jgi:hypothetical protein
MNFKLDFEIPKANFIIQHGEGILFLGSCFSDEMSEKAKFHGLNVKANHFGTVFHPSLLSQFISDSIDGVVEERIFNRNDVFLSWDANSSVFDFSENELSTKIKDLRAGFVTELKSAKALFVTFGTAWVYRKLDDNNLVANCHKISSDQFSKELKEIDEMYEEWKSTIDKIRTVNKELEIVFTVSPVRHSKDGLVENNQSKAILIELVRRLTIDFQSSYFPSYEIILDELRDYRFFKLDRVHPSEEAIEYVWKKFEACFCSEETILLNQKVSNFRRTLAHRSIHEGSKENQAQKIHSGNLLNEFLKKYPKIIFCDTVES